MQINLASNKLCGLDDRDRGTYTSEGIKAIADSISANASLMSINLQYNHLGPEGAKALAPALSGRASVTQV